MARNTKPRQGADDAKVILNRVRQLVRALRAFDRQAQSRYGLGAAQMFILDVLRQERELSMNDLADRTATDQSSASLAVGRLEEHGYVRRMPGEADRRQVRVTLTARGRKLVRRTPPAAQEKIMDSASRMSTRERAQLKMLLEKLITGLGAEKERPRMLFQDEEGPSGRRR
jgi:DNA-binding MarR family transcriptional regulator